MINNTIISGLHWVPPVNKIEDLFSIEKLNKDNILEAYCLDLEKSTDGNMYIYSLEYCFYCNSYTDKYNRTLDHIVPLIKGGMHSEDNTVMACRPCNSSKRDMGVEEFFHKLAKQGEVFNV